MRRLLALAALAMHVALGQADGAAAHALDPAFLEVRAVGPESYAVSFKVPQTGGRPLPLTAALPENCAPRSGGDLAWIEGSFAAQWVAQCPGGLDGGVFAVDGLSATGTDALVRIEFADGTSRVDRLTAHRAQITIAGLAGFWDVVRAYFLLGVEHILFGVDHLLFVLALILLVQGAMRLVKTVTAFTVAHSITLSAAALGYVTVPGPPVEAVIALSIVFVAAELARRRPGRLGFSERYPWLIAFAFGLLHGFGFAGALAETGLPENEIPAALLTFNLGAEAGQLAFIGVVLALRTAAARMEVERLTGGAAARVGARGLIYVIGGVSAYWLIERTAGFLT